MFRRGQAPSDAKSDVLQLGNDTVGSIRTNEPVGRLEHDPGDAGELGPVEEIRFGPFLVDHEKSGLDFRDDIIQRSTRNLHRPCPSPPPDHRSRNGMFIPVQGNPARLSPHGTYLE
jgi:hypothetical protein